MAEIIKLDGFGELEKTLQGLSEIFFSKKIVRSALRKAAKPLISSARNKVMPYSKTIGKSITINYQSRDGATIGVGPKRKNATVAYSDGDSAWLVVGTASNPWFAHFVEFGTSGVGRFKKKGRVRYRADQPARPFMRPAFEETQGEIMKNFENDVWNSLEKMIAKV